MHALVFKLDLSQWDRPPSPAATRESWTTVFVNYDTHLGSLTTIVWRIIPIQVTCERLWQRKKFYYVLNCDLNLVAVWPWVKVTTHPLVMTAIVWNIILIQHGSCTKCYDPHTDLGYVCSVTSGIQLWVKVGKILYTILSDQGGKKSLPTHSNRWTI